MNQLTLEFEPAITERYGDLRECMISCVYNKGLSNVANDLGKSPGNLARELEEGDPSRHFSIESLERYIQKQKDLTPIYFLVARYMGDKTQTEAATMKRVEDLLSEVAALVGQSGTKKKQFKR